MTAVSALYEEGRGRVAALVREGPADATVPTCPGWQVRDVLAHVVGVCADVLSGNIEGVATEPWTAAQVDRRRGRSVDELLAEWDEVGPPVAGMADSFGAAGHQLLFDLTSHEHDIRAAVGRPGARDHEAVTDALGFLVPGFVGPAVDRRGLAPLEVVTEAGTFRFGTGAQDPVRLRTSAFELMRTLSGRRSARQIRAMDWSGGDPDDYLPVLVGGPFTIPAADVVE